jgi:glycosyltransferase involved in cell wall biosynthesis
MNNVFFSVVIPTYNRAKFIHNTISSVLVQDEEDFEVIVVDDGGTDNTEEIIQSLGDPRVRYFHKNNEERGAARNFGARQARGTFISFLDSDDHFYPVHLSEARKFISDNPGVKVFHLAYDYKDESGRLIKRFLQQKPVSETIINANTLSCNGVIVERSLFLDNPFIEERTIEDWELWIRLASRYTFLHSNSVTSVVVEHQQRSVISRDPDRIKAEVDLFCQRVSGNQHNRTFYGPRIREATATAKTYCALHIAMTGTHKSSAWRYLREGISDSASQIFTKRFVVTVLYLVGLKK